MNVYHLKLMAMLLVLLCGSDANRVWGQSVYSPPANDSPVADPISSGKISDVVNGVMQGNDFRSVRRRVLEQKSLPTEDESNSFLRRALKSAGNTIRDVFRSIGDGIGWVWKSLFGRSSRRNASPTRSGESLWQWGSGVDGVGFGQAILQLLTIILLLCLTVFLSWLAMTIYREREQRSRGRQIPGAPGSAALPDVDAPPGELPASAYEQRAEQFAARGDYSAAIRELLLGSMSWIERSGLILHRRGLTNRDYLRSVWRRPDQKAAWQRTSSVFEHVFFGRRKASEEVYQSCLQRFQGAFREEESSAAAQ